MPRVTKSVTAKAKHKKVLSATKGHYGARSRLYKTAKQSTKRKRHNRGLIKLAGTTLRMVKKLIK